MAFGLPRLLAYRGRVARAVGRAVRTTALDSVPADEREWIARIEARRRELGAEQGVKRPFDPHSSRSSTGAPQPQQPLRVDLASWMMSLPLVWCTLLMRLVRELEPRSCLELGTGFGISAAYQAAALELNRSGELTTLEGSPEWAEIAERGLSNLRLDHVSVLVGPIGNTLPDATRSAPFQYVFVDAEHTEEAMLADFDAILPHLSSDAVIAFDDIKWNLGTRRAWAAIKRHRRVSAAVGLGRVGLVLVAETGG